MCFFVTTPLNKNTIYMPLSLVLLCKSLTPIATISLSLLKIKRSLYTINSPKKIRNALQNYPFLTNFLKIFINLAQIPNLN